MAFRSSRKEKTLASGEGTTSTLGTASIDLPPKLRVSSSSEDDVLLNESDACPVFYQSKRRFKALLSGRMLSPS